jgi:translation initiation factor IF-2
MEKTQRLNKVLAELNISLERAVEYLNSHGFEVEARPTTKISEKEYDLLCDAFQTDRKRKVASDEVSEEKRKEIEAIRKEQEREKLEKIRKEEEERHKIIKIETEKLQTKVVGKIDLTPKAKTVVPKIEIVEEEKPLEIEEVKEIQIEVEEKFEEIVSQEEIEIVHEKEIEAVETPKVIEQPKKIEVDIEGNEYEKPQEPETIKTEYQKLTGPKIAGDKVDLSKFDKPKKEKGKKEVETTSASEDAKKKRKRIRTNEPFKSVNTGTPSKPGVVKPKLEAKKKFIKEEPTEDEVKKTDSGNP